MKNKIEFYSVKDFKLLNLFFKSYFGKYLFNRKKYHRYSIFGKSSIYKSIKMRYQVGLTKVVKHQNKFFSCISVPAYPSAAFDNMRAKGGFNFGDAGTDKKPFIDLILLAITSRCPLDCKHCYEKLNVNNGEDIPADVWIRTIKEIQNYGVGVIVLTGGEPLADFHKTLTILKSIDKNLSEVHLHTSGTGITKEKAELLKAYGLSAVFIGLDDYQKEDNNFFRGKGAYDNAVNAIKIFNEAGILTCTNICLSKGLVHSGGLWKYLEFVKGLNVAITHLIEPKLCGGFNESTNILFKEEEKKIIKDFILEVNSNAKYLDYPLVYSTNFTENKDNYGCMMGGLSHLYINSKGYLNPCVFLPVRFGNIKEKSFLDIYKEVRKAIPHPLKECAGDYIPLHAAEKKQFYEFDEVKDVWEEMYK
ncbi:MAG TPA: radical SAM protein [Ignavibacteriaceae bacterium]|nr:radical SAM protein [Ignavibacteriaceae bacterium]